MNSAAIQLRPHGYDGAKPAAPQIQVLAHGAHRQRRFVEEYVVDLNAFRAATRAGYSPTSSSCVNMLKLPNIEAAVQRALAVKRERAVDAGDRVVEELSRVAFANMLDYVRAEPGGRMEFDLAALSRDAGAAISRLRVEYHPASGDDDGRPRKVRRISIALAAKTHALKALARSLGVDRSGEETEVFELITGVPRHPDRHKWGGLAYERLDGGEGD